MTLPFYEDNLKDMGFMKPERGLSQFENLAQKLVEGSFKRLFGEQLEPYEVAVQLGRAMEDSQRDGFVADYYQVGLNPQTLKRLLAKNPGLAEELANYLTRLAQQAGLLPSSPPRVVFFADQALPLHQVAVRAEQGDRPEEESTQVRLQGAIEGQILQALLALDAYLIVAGQRHLPLDRPLLTLGRHTENDVVFDSPVISRHHAQIRWRFGRFVLYDLSQRGRTTVNGAPVSEHVLRPGDVIGLSGTKIIYGEGRSEGRPPPPLDDDGQTLQLPKV